MVEDLLAARGIIVSHETVRRWAEKFGRDFAIRSVGVRRNWVTNGIWMKSSSPSTASSIGCGAQWTARAMCWMLWCKAAAIPVQQCGFCAS
jgi:transposase-like protein